MAKLTRLFTSIRSPFCSKFFHLSVRFFPLVNPPLIFPSNFLRRFHTLTDFRGIHSHTKRATYILEPKTMHGGIVNFSPEISQWSRDFLLRTSPRYSGNSTVRVQLRGYLAYVLISDNFLDAHTRFIEFPSFRVPTSDTNSVPFLHLFEYRKRSFSGCR